MQFNAAFPAFNNSHKAYDRKIFVSTLRRSFRTCCCTVSLLSDLTPLSDCFRGPNNWKSITTNSHRVHIFKFLAIFSLFQQQKLRATVTAKNKRKDYHDCSVLYTQSTQLYQSMSDPINTSCKWTILAACWFRFSFLHVSSCFSFWIWPFFLGVFFLVFVNLVVSIAMQ